MSDQEQQSTETNVSSEKLLSNTSNDENQVSEKLKENELNSSREITMPQDIRYSTEQNDREKLMEKYNNYQISDIKACNIRFLTDNRQKKFLFGRNEEENPNLQSFAKTFNVNMFPGYQQTNKHSYKIFGTEANVRQCLIETMNRMFKRSNRSTQRDHHENNNQQTTTTNEKSEEIDTSTEKETDDKSPPHPTSVFVTTINPDSSITEEQKPLTPSTPKITEEKSDENIDLKFTPLERKPKYTFIMLISSQGQEVLKKNWNFFAGSLQQRLNVVVTNPVKLPKFGDKQIQNEISITGELIENLTDASLQISAFINDVLGVPIQPYQYNEESTNHFQRSKNENENTRTSSSKYQGRTFFNRNRNGTFEQIILIRNDCVARIIGTKGSNLKRIQTKCHLRDMIIGRQANENDYTECILTAYQIRNLHFAINTIRSFLKNEDDSAVLVIEPNHKDIPGQDSPHVNELTPLPPSNNTEQSSIISSELSQPGFITKSLNHYPQPSYNFQNTPSFDFTHQATSASRKTDKRRGELSEHNKTPNESQNQSYENLISNSPKHKSKRSCPETKDIDCTTDEGFWIQKQYYYALDETSKQLFDSLIEKLDKIRIANEENAARKQQRLVGRNRSNKSRIHTSSISYLNEDINQNEKDLIIKPTQIDQTNDANEEKENQQETSTVSVNQN